MTDPAKTMGVSVPVFLILAALCWIGMLGTIATWIGKAPVPGRETDRMISQVYSGGFAVLVWIFLAALLLIANSKNVMPAEIGFWTWFALPVSCVGALGAIAVLFKPERYWPAAIAAVMPLLIAGYVIYTFTPVEQTLSVMKVGYALWAVVTVLSISIVPPAIGYLPSPGEGSIQAKPGPEMDRFKARERQKYRDEVLDKLRHSDDETKLYELSNLIQPDNPALQEVLDFIRKMPNRQADAIQMFGSGSTILPWIADIDIQPTPELCTAARGYLHACVRQRESMAVQTPNSFVGIEFSEGIPGIRWIARNCGCNAELDEMEAYARKQQPDAPDVQKFLAALAEIREAK